jgi:ligand-binding sensor domain-containing protein
LHGQEGIPLINRYSVSDYHAGIENWDAIEDNNGLLYFANSEGILEYDGVHWQLIRTPGGNATRSFSKDAAGTIFVGGDYDFGYLQANSNGRKEFKSLVDKCPPEINSHLKHVWKVFNHQGRIYFLADGWLVVFDAHYNFIKIIKEDIYLRSVFVIGDRVYAYSNTKGILVLNSDDLKFTVLYNDVKILNRFIEFIAEHPLGGIRYHLFNEGFYHLNGGKVKLEKSTSTCTIDTDYIFCQSSSGNDFILGTAINGLYVIDKQNLFSKYHLEKSLGLNDNKVFAVFSDHYKNIWVCYENGLSYIVLNTPVRYLNEQTEIKGEGLITEVFNGSVFIGTSQGLFSCKQIPHVGFLNFKLFDALRQPVFFLKKKESKLLIGTLHGLFEYNGVNLKQISASSFNKCVQNCPFDSSYYLASTDKGFQLLEFANGFQKRYDVRGVSQEINDFEIDSTGQIWFIDSENSLHHGSLNKTLDTFNFSNSFKATALNGLKFLSLIKFKGSIIFGTNKGLFTYNPNSKLLAKISTNSGKIFDHSNINLMFNHNDSNLWLEGSVYQGGKLDYSVEVLNKSFNYINSIKNTSLIIDKNKISSFGNFNDSTLAIGVSEGFLLCNLNFKNEKLGNAKTYIRKISFRDSKDTIVEEGLWNGKNNVLPVKIQGAITTVEFDCAANYYYSRDKIFYSYKLEGLDAQWSDWIEDNKIKYIIQGHGEFVFKVRTKNNYEVVSEETLYGFKIGKPWYKTYWWYITEILTLVLLMSCSVYFNRNGSTHISRISAIIIVLTILTLFETTSELMQDWMDAQGETIFALKIAINIAIALSISPIEVFLKKKLIARPIS